MGAGGDDGNNGDNGMGAGGDDGNNGDNGSGSGDNGGSGSGSGNGGNNGNGGSGTIDIDDHDFDDVLDYLLMPVGEGETCEGFNEFMGMPFPECEEGLMCVDSGLITIPGAGNICVPIVDGDDSDNGSGSNDNGSGDNGSGDNGSGSGDNGNGSVITIIEGHVTHSHEGNLEDH